MRSRGALLPPATAERVREARIAAVTHLTERFLEDLAVLLGRGQDGMASYVEPAALAPLRKALGPFFASGLSVRPDFGEYAELTIEGELTDVRKPVTARVEFEDRSARETLDGRPVSQRYRRLRLTLRIDAALHTIVAQSFESLT